MPRLSTIAPAIASAALLVTAGCASQNDTPDEQRPRPAYKSVDGEQREEPETTEEGENEKNGESESGDANAESADSRRARREMMRKATRYQPRVVAAILKHWSPPSFDGEKLDRLGARAILYVRVDENGHVTSWKFRRRSGSEPFDTSIKRCLETFSESEDGETLPMPDDTELREAVVRQGFLLQQWDHRKAGEP